MKIQQRRTLQVEASQEELCARASAWAAKCGFVLETLSDNQLVFTKGSAWRAIYTFDIEKLPTKVSLTLTSESPVDVDCTYTVESLVSISTQGDTEKVSEQLDLLIACLNGTAH